MTAFVRPHDAPRVSIIIPTMTRREMSIRAVDSVLQQSFQDFEIIVVDDGSLPGTGPVAEDFMDPRVRLIRREVNGGAGAARNTGMEAARGEFIAFLDSDDEWLPDKLARQLAVMDGEDGREDKPQALVCGYVLRFPEGSERALDDIRMPQPVQDVGRLVWGCNLSPGTTLLFRRTVFEAVGGFDESFRRMEDWEWLIRVAERYRIASMPDPLVVVYVSARADYAAVRAACDAMRRRHARTFFRMSLAMALRFHSSLALELAAAAYNSRFFARAAFQGLLCLALWPWRGRSFYFRLARRLVTWRSSRLHPVANPRVMHIINGLGIGGAERMLTNLVTFSESSARHLVIALRSGGHYERELAKAGVAVECCNVSGSRSLPLGVFKLARLIRREKPDIVQAWMYHANLIGLIALWLSGRRRGTRFFWGIRCSHMEVASYPLQLRIMIWLNKIFSVVPELIIGNSFSGRDHHVQAGFRDGGFAVIPNGFDTERFRPQPEWRHAVRAALGIGDDAFVIATIARVDPMKDYPLLLAVLTCLPETRCLAIGRGTEKLPSMPNLIRLGVRSDIPDLLQAVDVLVSSSAFGEGMSNAIGEAMASGVPVVATDVGDSRSLVGDGGLVIPPRDVDALVHAIAKLRDNPDLRARLGAAARRRIEHHYPMWRSCRAFNGIYLTSRLLDSRNVPAEDHYVANAPVVRGHSVRIASRRQDENV